MAKRCRRDGSIGGAQQIWYPTLLFSHRMTYDRASIVRWFEECGKPLCPLTRQTVDACRMPTNARLQQAIQAWIEAHADDLSIALQDQPLQVVIVQAHSLYTNPPHQTPHLLHTPSFLRLAVAISWYQHTDQHPGSHPVHLITMRCVRCCEAWCCITTITAKWHHCVPCWTLPLQAQREGLRCTERVLSRRL